MIRCESVSETGLLARTHMFACAGGFEYGGYSVRIAEDLADRVSGPIGIRFFLKPTMASFLAILAGLEYAKAGGPFYIWSLFTDSVHRTELLRDGRQSVDKVFLLAVVLDVLYQFVVQKFVYRGEVIIVALFLAIVSYLVMRGLTNCLVGGRYLSAAPVSPDCSAFSGKQGKHERLKVFACPSRLL